MSALVLVGRGRYEDPWHDHAAVAHEVVKVLADGGLDVTVRGTFPGALDDVVTAAGGPELVVVVAGTGRTDPDLDGTDEDWSDFHAALDSLVGSGVPILALHASANTFTDSPVWARHLGGRWVPGVSMHAPIGEARFTVADLHPVTAGSATSPPSTSATATSRSTPPRRSCSPPSTRAASTPWCGWHPGRDESCTTRSATTTARSPATPGASC